VYACVELLAVVVVVNGSDNSRSAVQGVSTVN
jgi:hypothetical protein